ncbi:hydroxyethylthiazole kinase [Clostridium gasigenes]|uniref:hydroxyethylthiazole kinase n=1 Tax=Clostridium gasigenes TaxID=94869 RepID=UPI001C0B7485|nr:hydroxyethylthiazole kinase [Clostridium gasigenes]
MYKLINKVKEVNPLVLHYTNEVTINDCANATLALGGSPLMSYSYEEVEEIVSIASSVIINIGTMNSSRLNLFIEAGKAANKYNKPVILDPVGVFATKTRSNFINELLNKVKFDVIKGNVAEIKYIGGLDFKGKGVDSFDDDEDISEIIKKIAKKLECIVVATGKVDTITDGEKIIKINNGTPNLKSVTGTGCMTGSLIGCYIGACEDKLNAVAMGVLTMGLSGELADRDNIAIGTFKVNLMDTIFNMSEEKLFEYGKVEFI